MMNKEIKQPIRHQPANIPQATATLCCGITGEHTES
jgi:hypothetical protein